jgi:hypothetical protein
VAGGVPLILGPAGAVTEMLNAGSAAEDVPSLAVMMMLPYIPSCAVVGVPVSAPVEILNAAQAGLFWTENDSALPLGSLAVGTNEYADPAVTLPGGDPEITGGGDVADPPPETVMLKAGSDAEPYRSWAEMTMPENVLTLFDAGVPLSSPVVVLNPAHRGLFVMENRTERFCGADAVGVKL